MSIKELCEKTGLTKQAIYWQIKNKKGYGQHFKRNAVGKWNIDGRKIKDS